MAAGSRSKKKAKTWFVRQAGFLYGTDCVCVANVGR